MGKNKSPGDSVELLGNCLFVVEMSASAICSAINSHEKHNFNLLMKCCDAKGDSLRLGHFEGNKQQIYEAMIKAILLFGNEVWPLTKQKQNMLRATEMDFRQRSAHP